MHRGRSGLLLALSLGVATSDLRAAPPTEGRTPEFVPEDVASYTLKASLFPDEHRVTARGSITWTNPSASPAKELYFHLYLNAFESRETLYLRSPFGAGRSGRTGGAPGSIEVKRLTSKRFGDLNLWEKATTHSPGDSKDATDIRVPLPEPIAGGETVVFEVEFVSQLPELVERTGYAGSFHLVAQWFPKLAKREKNGQWAHFSFHPHTEFYADFGSYDVTLDAPEAFVLGATGRRVEDVRRQGRRIERYQIRGVHDFAWTAWDAFHTQNRDLSGVSVTLLSPPGAEWARSETWRALESALPHFSERYGAYPYRTLTVVHPPLDAGPAGGMEYPTFITTGGSPLMSALGIRYIDVVTVHELGHQWFQGMLASNEHAYPFLDEGLNSYAEWVALRQMHGSRSVFERWGLSLSSEAVGRFSGLRWGRDDIIAQPAPAFSGFGALASLVYSRTALAMTTLARVYGAERLDEALASYARKFRFQHPTPRDLLASVEEHVGPEAARALQQMLFERAWSDYAVRGVVSARKNEADEASVWVSRAVIARRGPLELPVEVILEFSDGHRQTRRLAGDRRVFSLDVEHSASLERVVVDPKHTILLDEDLLNNSERRTGSFETNRVSERGTYLAQLLLHALGP